MRGVLGGGIGGLSAAYYLQKRFPLDIVQIFESANRVGGWIRSKKLPSGSIFEQGPRTIRPKGIAGYNTLELINDINLTNEIVPIVSSHPAARNRMIYVNGKLLSLPNKLTDILKTIPPFRKPLIVNLINEFRVVKQTSSINDESIYNFVERRLGKDLADYAISPLICGICAGDAKEISVRFLMEQLFEKEQKYGSVIKGILYDLFKNLGKKKEKLNYLAERAKKEAWNVYSFKNGLETLPQTLTHSIELNFGKINLETTVNKIEFLENAVNVYFSNKQEQVKHLISSIPSSKLSELVKDQHPLLATYLKSIPHVTVAVVNLKYNYKLKLDNAFGFLVPPSQNIPILGVIYDSCCFPNKDETILTVMMGGHWFKKWFGQNPTEENIMTIALEQLRHILNIEQKPDDYQVNILRDCIPQYVVGHKDKIHKIEQYITKNNLPLSICGSSYYGVGVNDVILGAKNTVQNMPK